jgi:DNA-directed RNA polymerase specialized sigma subunit
MSTLRLNARQQALFDANQHLIGRALTTFRYPEHEDVRQTLEIALARAAKSYNAKLRIPFGGYAWRCLENALVDFRKRKPAPPSG